MNKEKLPKLVDVYRPSNPLGRRQLPLVVDENLTLVMDVRSSGIICDNQLLRGKDLEDFACKWLVLSPQELQNALQITKSELMHVLNQNVPCVGCRRSVERLYFQLFKFGHPTLDPLIVKPDGRITIKEDKQAYQVLGSIFHDHAVRLAKLIENQPKRNKKSVRCLLHSLDSQRSRPLTPVWRDVWDCMKPDCKKDVCIIEASSLHSTLETYLRKHRFCGECRTKVLKAYTLLVEEPEPSKEKGYVSSLYSGIKRCLPDKHIHLQTKTDYITKLISRAEPELLGSYSRRERHAKTLEIAQEEVLTCLGICMYERLHRIYMRMREEECTCQVFAAVAVHTLSRSFETAVERIRGVSQLELLYAEFAREEQQKQIRKEQKKIKRKRKKGKATDHEGKELCNDCDGDGEEDKDDAEKDCACSPDKADTLGCYNCSQLLSPNKTHQCTNELDDYDECSKVSSGKKDKLRCTNELWIDDCKCENDVKENKKNANYKCDSYTDFTSKRECGSASDHSHDCGYSSENNNGCCETGSLISSLSSSPEGSELACSDTCCQHETDFISHCRLSYGGNGQQLSLQEMLESHSEDDDEDCFITAEEVREFKSNNRQVYEQRLELRETLQKRFAQFCADGPVPRLLVQTKYASN
ncbi:gametogenetin-binding protein 2-like isoform X3 [Anoplophora glabripennis]|uniref:gametogenetin-binding protein 2-like isoform X3 n=1 Tax=Anoplophora glabripennis TaxID=217634 RepID=UPI000874B2EF|nr:gametogenetin-binding protein 2-like isoform X3 [Anoplophora glabripennis]